MVIAIISRDRWVPCQELVSYTYPSNSLSIDIVEAHTLINCRPREVVFSNDTQIFDVLSAVDILKMYSFIACRLLM